MEKLKNLSIKKTIILYSIIAIILSYIVGSIIVFKAERYQEDIWIKYIDFDDYYKALHNENENYIVEIPRVNRSRMNSTDGILSEVMDTVQTWTYPTISIISMIAVIFIFYRVKIRVPLRELTKASKNISNNNLDFIIDYKNKDELGILCNEFDNMKEELKKNNEKIWNMVEDEKILKAAIAHDIRTPLTVVKGYNEMLLEFISEKNIDEEGIITTLNNSMDQVERLEDFVDTMREISKIEDMKLNIKRGSYFDLIQKIEKISEYINENKITFESIVVGEEKNINIDKNIILRVVENLIKNAVEYADNRVELFFFFNNEFLIIKIIDDGIGFTDDFNELTKAYYSSNKKENHFGLGLYISKILTEKHGGEIKLKNNESCGTTVEVKFKI